MIVLTLIVRFVQILAALAVYVGLTNGRAFFEIVTGLAQGQVWDMGEFAKRLAAFSAPTVLGALVFIGLEAMLRKTRMLHARSLRYPDQPWLWNPKWAQRRIRLSNRTAILVAAVALAIYGFVVVPIGLWLASIKLSTGIYVFLGIMGVILLAFLRVLWLNRHWNRSELQISTLPGVIGGPFAGVVTLSQSFPQGTPFRVTLKCLRHRAYRSRTSRSSRSITDTVWQDQKILSTSLPAERSDAINLPCYFAIPYSCEPTTSELVVGGATSNRGDERVSYRWQLSVGMKETTDPRQASFEIPVFKTEQSSPDYQEDASIDLPFLEPVDAETLLETMPFHREYTATGERLSFSQYRFRDLLLLLAFSLALAVGVWAIFRNLDTPVNLFAAFIPAVLALVGFWRVIEMLVWKAEIDIAADRATFTAGYAWSRRRYEFTRGQAVPLECHEEQRRDTGNIYTVRLVPAQGPPCDIIKGLDGKQTAAALRDWLLKRLA